MKILFIPGLLCTEEVWGSLNTLRRDFECFDADVSSFSSITEMSRAASLLIEEEVANSIIAIGISMGGYVLLDMAIQNLKQLKKIILINTTPHSVNQETVPERLKMMEKARNNELEAVIEESKGFCFFNPTPETDELEKRMGKKVGAEAYIRQQEAIISRKDVVGDLKYIHIPSMVVTSKNDKILPISESYELFSLMGNSKLVAYSSCGHLSTLESKSILEDVLGFMGK